MGLRYGYSISQPQTHFHHPAQFLQPDAVVVLVLGAGFNQQYAGGLPLVPCRKVLRLGPHSFSHNISHSGVRAQALGQVQPQMRQLGAQCAQDLVHLQGYVFPLTQQVGNHHHPAQPLFGHSMDGLVRVRLDELQAGEHHACPVLAQGYLKAVCGVLEARWRAGAMTAPFRSARATGLPETGTFGGASAALAAMGQENHSPKAIP